MRAVRLVPFAVLGLVLIAYLPGAVGAAPVRGTVTTCSSTSACSFVFNTSAGTGWAKTSSNTFSFQLPGEASASYNLSYRTYIGSLTGTYTYWTVGNFLGTDVNTGHVVLGTTDTNYTITCHGHSGRGGGCTYTYTTDNGTVVVKFTQAELTATTLSCSPTALKVAGKTSCTVTVTNLWNSSNVPTGKVKLSSYGYGSFANKGACVLTAGSCTTTFHAFDNTCGSIAIGASYFGSSAYYKSQASQVLDVYVSGGC